MLDLKYKFGIIGGGNMAEAFIKGLINQKILSPEYIFISEPSLERRKYFKDNFNINSFDDNSLVFENCETILLAVKPFVFPLLKNDIKKPLLSK